MQVMIVAMLITILTIMHLTTSVMIVVVVVVLPLMLTVMIIVVRACDDCSYNDCCDECYVSGADYSDYVCVIISCM